MYILTRYEVEQLSGLLAMLPRKSRIGLVVLYLILILVLGELLANFFITNQWVLKTTSDLSSLKWQLKWEMANTQTQTTEYNIDEFDQLLGWAPKKGEKDLVMGENLVTFSPAGYRGSQVYSPQKPIGKTRIVVLGDSFTFGEEVNDAETYSAYLEKILPDSEVINFGVHGYGIDQMLLRLKQSALFYQPDIVIFAFINDDLNRTFLSFRDYQKPKFELINDDLVLNTPLMTPETLNNQIKFRSNLITSFKLLRDRVIYQNYPRAEIEKIVLPIWQATLDATLQQKAELILLYLPTGSEMINNQIEPLYEEQFMINYCHDKQIFCLSARKYLNQAAELGAAFKTDRHYEPLAHQIIAAGLAKDIQLLLSQTITQ